MTTRHEFLAQLHELIHPRGYLEIGVQHGTSLALAGPDTAAIGIDPHPLLDRNQRPNETIFPGTANHFFELYPTPHNLTRPYAAAVDAPFPPLDLAFIDGSHLAEDALRDFINIEKWSHPGTVVVFDDMLPRNQMEASRIQIPGDWTGDVWRIHRLLIAQRTDLIVDLVNTTPTGTMVVRRLDSRAYPGLPSMIERALPPTQVEVPEHVINRWNASHPEAALRGVSDYLAGLADKNSQGTLESGNAQYQLPGSQP